MKRNWGMMLCMLLAATLAMGGCKKTPPKEPDDGTGIENPSVPENPAEKKKLDFSATVEDCFATALEGAEISLNGSAAASTNASGAFELKNVEEAESNELSVSMNGFQTQSVGLKDYFKQDNAVNLGTFALIRNSTVVSALEARAWEDYEAFTLAVTRDSTSLILTASSPNRVFTQSGRKSTLEFYVSVGEVGVARDENITKVSVDGSGTTSKRNYGKRDISSYNVTADIFGQGDGLCVEVRLPFAMLGCNNDEIIGLAMGLYSDTDGARAELLALDGENKVDFFAPSTYIRTDKENNVFACPQNVYPEDVTPPVDKAALTAGYSMQFSVPNLCNQADGDDFYLKADRESDGFLISMIGFGNFTEKEYVKLIFHTSAINGTGWTVQASDLNVLVNRTKAVYRTNVTKFWTSDGGYSNFSSSEQALAHTPVYTQCSGYFTLTLKVLFSEIPEYDANGTVSLYAMEFSDNGTTNGLIYAGTNYLNGMLIDGVSHGDPAAQSSYFVIQGGSKEEIDSSLVEGYDMEFSMAADHIYAKVERGATSLTLSLRSFKSFDATDFVRFIVHAGAPIGANDWALDRKDVSFTVYKDSAFFQTDKISFYEGRENQFHGYEQTLHAPVYTEGDGYWSLTLEIEYIELGIDVNADTQLRAFLGEYVSNTLSLGAKQKGVVLGDQAYQSNWFILSGGEEA